MAPAAPATPKFSHRTLRGHLGKVWWADLSPDGKLAVSGAEDGVVRIWNAKDGRCLRELRTQLRSTADLVRYEHLSEMAAAYLFHLARNHPFIDGNKRAALAAALVFLELNDLSIDAPDETVPMRDCEAH